MSISSELVPMKVFFALWPTAAERDALAAWQRELKPHCGGRAMRAEFLHATLVFVGNVEPARLAALRLAAQQVDAAGFTVCWEQARYWGHNHIVYAAPGTVPELLRELVGALEQSLAGERFRFDRRAYKPHVTLLRNARCAERWVEEPTKLAPVCWQVQDFALLQSQPQDGRAQYRVLSRFPLRPS